MTDVATPALSLLIPCRNEEGNIRLLGHMLDEFPPEWDIVLVEGHSNDNTWTACQELADARPDLVRAFQQPGKGKMDAVLEAARRAKSDHVAIWDADLTIDTLEQRDLCREYLRLGAKALITGNRLNSRMHRDAMRTMNRIGNRFFARALSIALKTRVRDSLCGTKVFPKELLLAPRAQDVWATDPFGDFSLLVEARLRGMDILCPDVEYFARRYGSTNINRWRNGLTLLRVLRQILRHRSQFK